MKVDRDTMIQMLRGELDPDREADVRRAVEADPELTSELDRLHKLENVLAFSAADSFGPYFADRVMKRLSNAGGAYRRTFDEYVQWVFLRLAAASLLAVVGLGAYNALQARDLETSGTTVEAIFGLPSTDIESLYYLQGI